MPSQLFRSLGRWGPDGAYDYSDVIVLDADGRRIPWTEVSRINDIEMRDLMRIAALYKVEDSIRGSAPDQRQAVRQELSRPLVDQFFAWLAAQAARISRKSDLGVALSYMLRRQDGFRVSLKDGHVDMNSNLVENAIRSPAMNRRNALFAGHDEGGRSWARFASLIGTCKMNGVEPYAYLRDLFIRLANGHLDKDINALMPWA
jgi:transposase